MISSHSIAQTLRRGEGGEGGDMMKIAVAGSEKVEPLSTKSRLTSCHSCSHCSRHEPGANLKSALGSPGRTFKWRSAS